MRDKGLILSHHRKHKARLMITEAITTSRATVEVEVDIITIRTGIMITINLSDGGKMSTMTIVRESISTLSAVVMAMKGSEVKDQQDPVVAITIVQMKLTRAVTVEVAGTMDPMPEMRTMAMATKSMRTMMKMDRTKDGMEPSAAEEDVDVELFVAAEDSMTVGEVGSEAVEEAIEEDNFGMKIAIAQMEQSTTNLMKMEATTTGTVDGYREGVAGAGAEAVEGRTMEGRTTKIGIETLL